MVRWTRFRRMFGLEPRADVDHELSFHLEMRIRELVDRGESPARARELALRRFGDYQSSRRECVAINERRRRRFARADYVMDLRQDIGYALRLLRRTPGFTTVAVVTLALGIGANSAIFSVVHGVLLESLPFRDADRIYHVNMLYPDGTVYAHSSPPDFMSVREATQVFEQVDAYVTSPFTLLGSGEAREVQGASVSDGLFRLLGLRVEHGRGFLPEENQPGRGRVTVLGHGFWTQELGGDRHALGRHITLGGNAYIVVGVLAPGAGLPTPADLYVPLEYGETFSATASKGRRGEFLAVLGRARPGLSARQIDDDVRRIGTHLQQAFPDSNEKLTFTVKGLRETIVGEVRTPLLVLLGAVAFVLLVACANVANLLLARASVRQGELAVRAALGASRLRLVRQLLTESVVLGVAGGGIGLGMAYWGTRILVAAQPTDIPRLANVGVNGPVVLFTFAVALLTSFVVGVLPATHASGERLTRALREGGRGSGAGGGSGHRMRAALVVAEMTLAVVLLMGAGLLIRSFVELTRVDPGFRASQAMAFRISMQGEAYQDRPKIRQRVADMEARLRALPRVTAVASTTVLPLSGRGALIDFLVEGAPPPPPDVNQEIGIASVTPDYFKAIGTPLQRGRPLTDRDDSDAPRVVLINESAARFWFPGQDPIGRRVNMSGNSYEVVGVVADLLQRDPGRPAEPQLFVPYAQRTTRTVRMVVRTAGDPVALAAAIRAEIRALDRNLPIEGFTPLEQVVAGSVARPRFYTALLTLFAGVALALASTGIFGVMSYTVAQRAREISIRMALGAQVADVLHLIVGRAAALAAAGLVLGVAGALALGRVIETQLFGVALLDLPTLGSVVLVLAISASVASVLPVVRATRLDPSSALREG